MDLYNLLKPYLFLFDPEEAHLAAEKILHTAGECAWALRWMDRTFAKHDPILEQTLWGNTFPNPVGLGAGFDKNALMARALVALGLGSVEVGTVTPRPQEGNPRPRLFRYPARESVQNAMGFNNDGMAVIRERVAALSPIGVPIGVNIGKNKMTPADKAIEDYLALMAAFDPVCDYMAVNISSPNTVGLRDLQNESFIAELFAEASKRTSKPILLKIAPDMDHGAAITLSQTAVAAGAAGIIATNTTTDYALLPGARDGGGLSGRVLTEKSFAMFDALSRELYRRTVLISVGGIDSGAEAYRRIRAGASLIQVYTGFIFKGPALFGKINRELAALLRRDGFASLTEAIGCDRR